MTVAQRPQFTREDSQKIDAILSLLQSDGQSMSMQVDRDWLLQEGNEAAFMLHYFRPAFGGRWEELNSRMLRLLEDNVEGMYWLPGGHGKTTTILRWMIMVMCREPQISFIYVEKNEPTAMKRANAIMQQLVTNQKLIHDFGDFKGELWSTKNFTIAQRPEAGDWPTLAVYGAKGGALGNRCNIFIGDDLVTTENSDSEVLRNDLDDWWGMAAATCPIALPLTKWYKYGRKTFIGGTTFHMDDQYHRIRKRDPEMPFLHLRAVDPMGNCLAPDRFTYKTSEELEELALSSEAGAEYAARVWSGDIINLLEFKLKKGTRAFNQRYQNIVSDPALQKFPEVWFRGGEDENAPIDGYPGCLDDSSTLGGPAHPNWVYATGVDPQSGSNTRDSARFVSVTLGADPKEPDVFHVADIDYGRYPLESDNPGRTTQANVVLEQSNKYGSRIALETNNIQHVYVGVFKRAAKERGMNVSISGHWTTKNKKMDPEVGIESMQAMIENGNLKLPYKNVTDRRKMDELIDEFVNLGVYPTDDIVMATWFAWMVLKRRLKSANAPKIQVEDIPVYRSFRPGLDFPPQWTKEQQENWLSSGRTEEEDEEL